MRAYIPTQSTLKPQVSHDLGCVFHCRFLILVRPTAGFYSQPEWSAFRDETVYGSGRLSVRSPTKALWEWMVGGRCLNFQGLYFNANL